MLFRIRSVYEDTASQKNWLSAYCVTYLGSGEKGLLRYANHVQSDLGLGPR